MAKKSIASLRSGTGKEFSKVITMTKSSASGAYSFKEQIVANEFVKNVIAASKKG